MLHLISWSSIFIPILRILSIFLQTCVVVRSQLLLNMYFSFTSIDLLIVCVESDKFHMFLLTIFINPIQWMLIANNSVLQFEHPNPSVIDFFYGRMIRPLDDDFFATVLVAFFC